MPTFEENMMAPVLAALSGDAALETNQDGGLPGVYLGPNDAEPPTPRIDILILRVTENQHVPGIYTWQMQFSAFHTDKATAGEWLRHVAATYATPRVLTTGFLIDSHAITELYFTPAQYVGAVRLTEGGGILHHVAMDATATVNPR